METTRIKDRTREIFARFCRENSVKIKLSTDQATGEFKDAESEDTYLAYKMIYKQADRRFVSILPENTTKAHLLPRIVLDALENNPTI